jgi:hypothetical protein
VFAALQLHYAADLPCARAGRPDSGHGLCGSCHHPANWRRAMTLLLILLMIFFGVVLLWAGARLYRMLRARLRTCE